MKKSAHLHTAKLKRWKRLVAGFTLTLPFSYLAFVILDRYGCWDKVTGLDLAEKVSTRFDLSYANDASQPVRVGDKEWAPLLSLIYRYSRANFSKDKEPHIVARMQAPFSTRTPEEG